MYRSIMLTLLLFLLLLFAAGVVSYPASTLLNQRHQEISWEAWLLIDDQNQATIGGGSGTPPRRRITPKSVFVAQTFSPENLPPCAEGYSSDDMGRCVKMIKLDEDKHLEFLVSKLNEQFGSSLDYDAILDESGPEPTRLDIPLSLEEDYSNDTPQGDLEMAIIVTPTTKDTIKKRDQQELIYEEELKKLANTKYEYTTFKENSERKRDDRTTTEKDDEETTTSEIEDFTVELGNRFGGVDEDSTNMQTRTEREDTTVTTSTESVPVTTIFQIDERTESSDIPFTTTSFSTDSATSTTVEDVTTKLPGSTISTTSSSFTPTTTESTMAPLLFVDSTITSPTTSTTIKITTYHPMATTYHPQFDFSKMSKSKNLVRFPEEPVVVPRSHADGNYVKFPDNADDINYQQESSGPRTRDVKSETGIFFNEIVTPESSQLVNERILPPKGGFYPAEDDSVHTATTERNPYSKKPKVRRPLAFQRISSAGERHRPIVLRFSRKHFHFDPSKFKNSEFYRSVPMDDLTYLFGYKHGQR